MAEAREIAFRLAAVRGIARVVPSELAARSGVSVERIHEIEAGFYTPSEDEVQHLADSLDVLPEFLEGEEW